MNVQCPESSRLNEWTKCDRQPSVGFSDLCPGIHTRLWSPPLGYGLDMGTRFLGKECGKSDGMSLLKLTQDHNFGLLILLLSSLSLVLIKQAVLSYTMERPLWKGQELKVFSTQQPVKNWPIAHSPQPTGNWVLPPTKSVRLGSRFFYCGALRWPQPQPTPWLQRGRDLSCAQISDSQKLRRCCFLKPLILGWFVTQQYMTIH